MLEKAADMTAGIWLLFNGIAAADRDHYVDWFHRYHTPEKLARPGYRKTVHFEASPPSGNSNLYRYIGMLHNEREGTGKMVLPA